MSTPCHCQKCCPFLGTPPLTEDCLFADALGAIDTGLMLGRPSTGEYFYKNTYAERVFESLSDALSLDRLTSTGAQQNAETALGKVVGSTQAVRQIVRSRGKVIGLTVYLTGQDVAIVSLKDITQEAYFSESLRSVSADGEVLMRIFAQLRHELGNPLNSIKVTLQVLKENIETFDPMKINTYITRIIDEVARLEKLLVSMREYSRHDAMEMEQVNLREVFDDFCRLVENESREVGMDLSVEVEEDVQDARADSRALIQILHNLWRNAIQARVGDHGNFAIRARRGEQFGTVRIEVQDDGRGIPLTELPMVFKPMFTTKTEGSGLGLAVVERLITHMGGSISVSSEQHHYTRFDIVLRDGGTS